MSVEETNIAKNVQTIKSSLSNYPNVRIIAAVKYYDVEKTKEIVEAGIKDIGENRKDAFLEKYNALKDMDITWHYFGTIKIPPRLSTNFIDSIDYLHSLDSIDLANAINKARKKKEPLKCFVKVDVTNGKSGLTETKVVPFIKSLAKYEKIEVVGLMTIAKMTFDEEVIHENFNILQELQKEIQDLHLDYAPCTELSMGMTNDYLIAVEHNATMVRLGRAFEHASSIGRP